MLGSWTLHSATTRRMALRRTGEAQKCQKSTVPEISLLSLGTLPAGCSGAVVLVAAATGAVVLVAAAAGAVVSVGAATGAVVAVAGTGVAVGLPISHAVSTGPSSINNANTG